MGNSLARRPDCCLWVLLAAFLAGCGASSQFPAGSASGEQSTESPEARRGSPSLPVGQSAESPATAAQTSTGSHEPSVEAASGELPHAGRGEDEAGQESAAEPFQRPEWTDSQLAFTGVRKLAGKHLSLYTDLPPSPAVDELPEVFDQAIPHWCAYFELPLDAVDSWQINGYLMRDQERFRRAGMFPDGLPEFLHGFQRGAELWLYEQPSDYYRRHLLLHEGTHGFMKWSLGGAGPPWYMEGVAELLATHRWIDGHLTLRYFPRHKDEVPQWGRIKKIQDEMQRDQGRTLLQILRYDATAHLEVAPYAWCWAAAAFFDNHPSYRRQFRDLRQSAHDSSARFSREFYARLDAEASHLARQWQLYVINMEYGYDVAREAIQRRPVVDLPPGGATVQVLADHGWQSSGFRLDRGQKYRIEARGRYQIAKPSRIWWSEANGITLRFHGGLPLGMLLGALVDEDQPVSGTTRLAEPHPIGLGRVSEVEQAGTLYLRVNDSPAELDDNAGQLTVRISRVTSG